MVIARCVSRWVRNETFLMSVCYSFVHIFLIGDDELVSVAVVVG